MQKSRRFFFLKVFFLQNVGKLPCRQTNKSRKLKRGNFFSAGNDSQGGRKVFFVQSLKLLMHSVFHFFFIFKLLSFSDLEW
jgi:hypothetical protein